MWPNWLALLEGFFKPGIYFILFFKSLLLVIQQAKSVNQYSVTLATTADVVIGMDGHTITVFPTVAKSSGRGWWDH